LLTFALLVGITAWVAWSERTIEQNDASNEVDRLFPSSEMDVVNSITWLEGDRTLRVERDKEAGRSWFVAREPLRLASEAHVLAAIRSVITLRARRSFQPESAPGNYGFSTLSPRIRLEGADGLLAEITLGSDAPLSGARYIRTASSETLYLVSQDLLEPALRDSKDFLDMRVLGIAPLDVDRLEIVPEGEPTTTISRTESGGFQTETSTSAGSQPMQSDIASDLLFALAELRGTRLAEQSEGPGGTDAPSWTVKLRTPSGENARLLLGHTDPEGDLFALASGSALPPGVGNELLLIPATIREQLENTRKATESVGTRP